jgi:hypothetical protein
MDLINDEYRVTRAKLKSQGARPIVQLVVATVSLILLGLGSQDYEAVRNGYSMLVGNQDHNHTLCVITRVRNRASYLSEWVDYHRLLGVDHFYVVDDCSDDYGQ